MKAQNIIFLAAAIVASPAMTLSAQTGDGLEQIGQPVRANEIIGSTVRSSHDEKLGTIKDVAVDLENGRIVEVVVARGGFLGADQKLVAVTPQSFTADSDHRALRLNLSKETLDRAPAADLANWSDNVRPTRVEEVYQYYGFKPYFTTPTYEAKDAANPVFHHLRDVERADRLLRVSTLNPQGENIGEVSDLILDFPAGRVVEVFIASGHFLGVKDEISAVPPQVLHFNAERNDLTLNATSETLMKAPHFGSHAWLQIDAEQAGEVYRAYHVTPYFMSLDLGAAEIENAGQSDADMMTSLDSVESEAAVVEGRDDKSITSHIKVEIQNAGGLSPDARKIKVRTISGHVTLSGTVAGTDEKRRLGRIAAHYAVGGQVANQLEVKPASTVTANQP